MKKLFFLVFLVFCQVVGFSQDLTQNIEKHALLTPSNPEKAASFIKENNITVVSYFNQLGIYLVEFEGSYQSFERKCKSSNAFKTIEQDRMQKAKIDYTPNDPLFSTSWHLKQTTDADIDADEAWDLLPANNPYVTVAVFDGGLEIGHEDLIGRWNNPFNATNNLSIADFVGTYDKHGTACSGTICATTNNAKGSSGVGGNAVQVMPICIMTSINSLGSFSTSASIQINAINAAMANPTCVAISMSYGGDTFSQALSDAFDIARISGRGGKGLMIFASSGNNGLGGSNIMYPASYTSVWGVGATTSTDFKASFSNYGDIVDLSAPGSSITTTDRIGAEGYNATSDYSIVSGTSFSCPITAGVAAMIAYKNYELTSTQIFGILSNSCDKVGGYVYANNANYLYSTRSVELGYGRINAKTSLQQTPMPGGTPPPPPTPKHNLIISSVSVTPSTINLGQSITINCVAATQNPELNAVNSILQYRYSTNNSWGDADDVIIGTDTTTLGGGISSGNESITFTPPISPGVKFILVRANYTYAIAESFIGDNTNTKSFTVVDPLVAATDASIEFVSPSTTGSYNSTTGSMTVKMKVTNTGSSVITSFTCTRDWTNCSSFTSFVPCSYSTTWTGTLLPGQSVLLPGTTSTYSVSLCQSSTSCAVPVGGSNTYRLTLNGVNGYFPDSNVSNNVATCLITRLSTANVTNSTNIDHIEVYNIHHLNETPVAYRSFEEILHEQSGFYVIHVYHTDGTIEVVKRVVQ